MLLHRDRDLTLADTQTLLQSAIHEERLCVLIVMTEKYRQSTAALKGQLYELYLANTRYINNWDLVDTSAEHIIGA